MQERTAASKRVLIAVDLQAQAPWALHYAIKLAGRLPASLTLLAVSPPSSKGEGSSGAIGSPGALDQAHGLGLDRVVQQCQREGVNLAVFYASGPFFPEVMRFLRSQPTIQFLVIGVPRESSPGTQPSLFSELKPLNRLFDGEILLVREQGRVTSMSEMSLQKRGGIS
jgi:hypothetical protein